MQRIEADADPQNRDWTKQTWDLPFETVEEVREWLARTGRTVEEFRGTPAFLNALERQPWLADL